MKLKNIVAAIAAGIALALPSAAQAYEYNDGTYIWGFGTYVNDNNEQVAYLYDVCRVDGQKISGAFTFPATVSAPVTNELGYSKYDEATGKYTWQSTRAQKVVTLTLPVETIDWWEASFKTGPVHEEEWGTWRDAQDDPLITSVTIPEGVEYVYGLESECLTNVTAVSFPSTVKSIESCFGYCDKLASVSIPENAYVDYAFVGTPWAKAMGDFFVWNGNLIRYQGTATEVVVPEGVVVINEEAFTPNYNYGFTKEQNEMFASAANITSVLLPSSLEEIGGGAFSYCEKLAAINIPNGVYAIGGGAFEHTALTAITLPESIRELRSSVFAYTAISSLVIPDGPQWFEGACAYMTNLTSVTLPATAQFFMYTFMGCEKLTAVDIPDSVEEVLNNSFAECTSLTSVTGGAGLKYVDSTAFGYEDADWDWEKGGYVNNGTGVPFYDNAPVGFRVLGPVAYGYKGDLPENLTVPAGVKYVMGVLIPDSVDKSAAKTLTLSEGVETVGFHAFANCDNLETVNLGNTVTNLASHAFVGCDNLTNVTGGEALEIGCEAFIGTQFMDDKAMLAGNDEPFGLIRLGKVVLGYKGKFAAGEFNIPADVTDFGLCGWDGSTANVTALTGGAALKGYLDPTGFGKLQRVDVEGAIGGFYCWGLEELADVNLPNAKLLGIDEMFDSCANLVNVAVGLDPELVSSGWASISGDAFLGCDKLQSVNIRCSGCKLKGYEVEFHTGKETFAADDVQVFKYIGQRTDFAANSWDSSSTGWSWFSIYPEFVKEVKVTVNGVEKTLELTVGMPYGELPDPGTPPEGCSFGGWFTQPNGEGRRITADSLVETGDEALYQYWQKSGDPEPPVDPDAPGVIVDPTPKAEDVVPVKAEEVTAALSYNGYLAKGNEIVGSVTVKVAKKSKVTATVQLPKGSGSKALKKFSYAGTLGADGSATLTCKKNDGTMSVKIGAKALSGKVTQDGETYDINGRLGTKDALGSADSLLDKNVWTVALHTPTNGIPHALVNGYSVLTVTGAKKGKVKVAGFLTDGTKVSVTAQGTVFDSCVIVPVNVALYKGKAGGFSLKLKIEGEKIEVGNVSDWTAVVDGETVTVKWDAALASAKSDIGPGAAFGMDAADIPFDDFVSASADGTTTLPGGVKVDSVGGKWSLPKAGKVAITKDKSDYDTSKFGENPAGLKLSYAAKTGAFKGSFSLYRETAPGKLKKVKATVNGVVVNGVGYGSAVIKKTGSMPVTVR